MSRGTAEAAVAVVQGVGGWFRRGKRPQLSWWMGTTTPEERFSPLGELVEGESEGGQAKIKWTGLNRLQFA